MWRDGRKSGSQFKDKSCSIKKPLKKFIVDYVNNQCAKSLGPAIFHSVDRVIKAAFTQLARECLH
jgi:hypothetical protein